MYLVLVYSISPIQRKEQKTCFTFFYDAEIFDSRLSLNLLVDSESL